MTNHTSTLIDEMFKTIPPEIIRKIKARQAKQRISSNMIHVQSYLPMEWVAIGEYFGAFDEGEAVYIRGLVRDDINRKLTLSRPNMVNGRK